MPQHHRKRRIRQPQWTRRRITIVGHRIRYLNISLHQAITTSMEVAAAALAAALTIIFIPIRMNRHPRQHLNHIFTQQRRIIRCSSIRTIRRRTIRITTIIPNIILNIIMLCIERATNRTITQPITQQRAASILGITLI